MYATTIHNTLSLQFPFSDPKERQPVKLGEFVDISPPPGQQQAITDGRETGDEEGDTPVGENNNQGQDSHDDTEGPDAKSNAENQVDICITHFFMLFPGLEQFPG